MTPLDVVPIPGLDPEIGLLGAALIDSTREWREELEELKPSAASLTWQAEPGGVSIGALFLHLIETELWWIQTVAGGIPITDAEVKRYRVDEIDQYADKWPQAPEMDLGGYFTMLQEVRERTLAVLGSLGSPDRVVPRPGSETKFTLRWILVHVLQHDSYHGGQAVMLAKKAIPATAQ